MLFLNMVCLTVGLAISNLPPGYTQRQYEAILIDILGRERDFTFEEIYHEYGSLVISYQLGSEAVQVRWQDRGDDLRGWKY
jgi:hypothetical protein